MALAHFDTQHEDMIHDAQMDYYSKRLATCSSDRKIKIFEIEQGKHKHLTDLIGHVGPVWQVSWAHPKFGSIIASCSYDRKVIIWKQQELKDQWIQIFTYTNHQYSVNSISWAPHEYGLCLACASSDGYVSLITLNDDGTWGTDKFEAHHLGVNSVSWAPATYPSWLLGNSSMEKSEKRRLVTGGCDHLIKIWVFDQTTLPITNTNEANKNRWQIEHSLAGHKDWVRDVQWAPNIGLASDTIASGSQDGVVMIWTQDHSDSSISAPWIKRQLEPTFNEPIWRLSWSLTGNILAVSSGDNKVTLWKESLDHQWQCISTSSNSNDNQDPVQSIKDATNK